MYAFVFTVTGLYVIVKIFTCETGKELKHMGFCETYLVESDSTSPLPQGHRHYCRRNVCILRNQEVLESSFQGTPPRPWHVCLDWSLLELIVYFG